MCDHIKAYGLTQMQVSTLVFRQMPKELTIYEKMLLIALADRYRDGQAIEIGLDDLVDVCSVGQRSVSTYMKKLTEKGYVKKQRVGLGEKNRYWLDLEKMNIDVSDYSRKLRLVS